MLEEMRQGTHPAYRFIVDVEGERLGAFTECTLPMIEWEYEEVKEGGLNTYVHRLPGRRKPATLTLKYGVGSPWLFSWYTDCMSENFQRKNMSIAMVDSNLNPVMTYYIEKTYPTKWTGPGLKSGDGSGIMIQTLEFVCGEVTVEQG